jgi:hypothetical protein
VSNFYKMLGNQPELLRGFNQLYGAVWAEGALAAKLKELAYLLVQAIGECAAWVRRDDRGAAVDTAVDTAVWVMVRPGTGGSPATG